MTEIKTYEELRKFLEHFTFEQIGFIRTGRDEHFIEYHKKRRHRADLYVKVNPKTFESQVYRCNEAGQPESKKGTFNIRSAGEVLFLLTHCLNELRVEQSVLEKCKAEIGYDQANVVPARPSDSFIIFAGSCMGYALSRV